MANFEHLSNMVSDLVLGNDEIQVEMDLYAQTKTFEVFKDLTSDTLHAMINDETKESEPAVQYYWAMTSEFLNRLMCHTALKVQPMGSPKN